jgi:hypothetical protein
MKKRAGGQSGGKFKDCNLPAVSSLYDETASVIAGMGDVVLH